MNVTAAVKKVYEKAASTDPVFERAAEGLRRRQTNALQLRTRNHRQSALTKKKSKEREGASTNHSAG